MSKENPAGSTDVVLAYTRKVILDYGLIKAGERVLIGLSGGVDSMVLAYCLMTIGKEIGFNIGCAHLHHGLRGEDADADLDFVSNFCAAHNIAFFKRKVAVQRISEERHISIENAGREMRYAFFDDVMEKHHYDKLALAHHADDQAETILMRLARGTGIKGASGMRLSSGKIIRPLLGVSRRAIEAFAQAHRIDFRQDATNEDRTYSRNYIRHEILPRLEQRYPGTSAHIAAFAEDAALYEAFFEREADRRNPLFSDIDGHTGFPINALMEEDILMRSAIIRRLIAKAANLTDIHRVHIEKILLSLNKGKTTWLLNLPYGIIAERRYDWLICYKKEVQNAKPYLATQDFSPQKNALYVDASGKQALTVSFNRDTVSKNYNNCKNNDEIILGYGKIKHKLIIRHRMPGDKIMLSDGKHQKLKDFLINQKIPSALRKHIFLVLEDETIKWIPGFFKHTGQESIVLRENTVYMKWEHINER